MRLTPLYYLQKTELSGYFKLLLLTVVFSLLPGGCRFTMGGGWRWYWGFPLWILYVHGPNPISPYYPGALELSITGLLGNCAFWFFLFTSLWVSSTWVTIRWFPQLRASMSFFLLIGLVLAAYAYVYQGGWSAFVRALCYDHFKWH